MSTALIIGASGVLGRAVQEKFRANEVRLLTPSRQDLDISSDESINYFFAKGKEAGIEDLASLVVSAGINEPIEVSALTRDHLLRHMEVNALGILRLFQLAIPLFKKNGGGKIVAISSIYGTLSRPGRAAYSASKASLEAIVRTVAIEFAPDNVLANCVSPGFVDSVLTQKNNSPEEIANIVSRIPLQRMGKPEEIADLVYFLASPQNSYITGQNIYIDGGYTSN